MIVEFQRLIEENVEGENILSKIEDLVEQVVKTTSVEGRNDLKKFVNDLQTRWSNLNLKQKQIKKILQQIKIEQVELEESFEEIRNWIDENQKKYLDLTENLSLHEENRKRFYQIKSFLNEIVAKENFLRRIKEKNPQDERFSIVEQEIEFFHNELRVKKIRHKKKRNENKFDIFHRKTFNVSKSFYASRFSSKITNNRSWNA